MDGKETWSLSNFLLTENEAEKHFEGTMRKGDIAEYKKTGRVFSVED